MFKKKKPIEELRAHILPEVFREIKIDPYRGAADQAVSLATFLLREVDKFEYKITIESDIKTIRLTVSVETHKTSEDG